MIPVYEPRQSGEEQEYLKKCVDSNWFSSEGDFVSEFEGKFSDFCGAEHGVATSSGTTALHLALEALGIGEGDEVIIPAFTMIATANAVKMTGAELKLADVKPGTGNIDPESLKEAISDETDAVIVVHIYGHPADMDPINSIAREHGAKVIEDAAESHGALYRGERVGSLGDVACFSFYGNKMITTGEGGMVLTDDEEIRDRGVKLRKQAFGEEKHFVHHERGFNYTMSNMEAAVGVAQMEILEENIEKKKDIARQYRENLSGVEGVETPEEEEWAESVFWMYNIRVENTEAVREHLRENGIETRPGFTPIHEQPVFEGEFESDHPVSERFARETVLLPSSPKLTSEEIDKISAEVEAAVEESRET